jgi:putative ABC transport system permease protein
MNLIQLTSAIELGLIYSLVTLGVLFTFRIINFRDLTVDGSFPLGAALTAIFFVKGYHPLICTLFAFLGGVLSGLTTAYLHTKWKIAELLASILVMTSLYSINLRIMGSPNISIIGKPTIFSLWGYEFLNLILLVFFIYVLAFLFLNSQAGLALRVAGQNHRLARAYGVNLSNINYLVLGLSNGLIALGGSLLCQFQQFSDISMGTGTLIVGFASVILGEKILRSKRLHFFILSALVGSLIYRIFITLALNLEFLQFHSSDLNLITSLLVIIALVVPKIIQKAGRTLRKLKL